MLNRQLGGRLKGLSKLTGAEKVDSRLGIAGVAQVSVGNVHKVKYILTHACLPLKEAARANEVSIHLAHKWSHECESSQREHLRIMRIERGLRRTARRVVAAEVVRAESTGNERVFRLSDFVALVNQLTMIAPDHSEECGSIEVHLVDGPGRAVFITGELLNALNSQKEIFVP
jgi:hypothetical protein